MSLAVFGSSNPQPVAYTGTHLKGLTNLYNEFYFIPLGIMRSIFGRIMIIGTTVRMIADSARYTSHAFGDCLQNKNITLLAIDSLGKGVRHLILAVISLALGIFSPTLIIKLADQFALIPHRNALTVLGSVVKSTAKLSLVVGACFCVARVAFMADQELAQAPEQFKQFAALVTDKMGDINVKSAGAALGALACCKIFYHLATFDPIAMTAKFFSYSLVPRNFSL